MDFDAVKAEAERLGPWVHFATVGDDGYPDVTPVHPAWEGDRMWVFVEKESVKARHVARHDHVALHWQVSEESDFDSLLLWGIGSVHDDIDTKRRLWTGVFDYDLSAFVPGGPDDTPTTAFLAVDPKRALMLRHFGLKGRDEWHA